MGKKKSNAKSGGVNKKANGVAASNGTKLNGKASKKNAKQTTKSFTSWSTAIIVAIMAFAGGILTKPVLNFLSNPEPSASERNLSSSGSSSSSYTSDGPLGLQSCNHDADELQGFLADVPVPGQHTLCFQQDSKLSYYFNSRPDSQAAIPPSKYTSWNTLKQHLIVSLNLENRRFPNQAWVLFDKDGERIVGDDDEKVDDAAVMRRIQESGIVVVYEGGIFIWPGIREGYVREISLEYAPGKGRVLDKRNATLVTLSLKPLVFSVTGFLSEEECDYIQEQAEPNMQYSGVTLMDKDKGRPASDFRTSQTAFLGTKYKGLEPIDLRTSSLVRIPRTHQEHVQVLRYGKTEKYNAHHDFFAPHLYKNDPNTLRMIEHGKKNRLATVFWYLSTVPKGGETIFPRHNGLPPPTNMADCSVGLKVKPERGKVIIFYSMNAEGGTDEYSLHGACPVEEGLKWAANKWVWNKPTGFYGFS